MLTEKINREVRKERKEIINLILCEHRALCGKP